ncbi:gamma-glutamyltransferase [Mesobacillus maritimus]|uniref:gamma-glutamyltransferase n=1 Tax=Mesobacillus maritimus TaxID=1643336 RepID=UPI00384D5494
MTKPKLKTLIGLIIFTMLLTVSIPQSIFAEVLKEQDSSIVGYGGAAATEDPDASKAALTILDKGGNAVDAAIAAAAAQSVTRPYSGGLGGGGMMLIYLAEENRYITIDNRSAASENFGPTALINPETGLVYPEATRISSGAATSIPGAVKAWEEALEKYGTMTLKEVLQPAIKVAENGFVADSNFVRETTENANRFKLFESTKKVFLDENGQVPTAGSIVKNPDMAHTYRLIAKHGSSVFYEGEIAEAIVETVNTPPIVDNPDYSSVNSQWSSEFGVVPGAITLEDLKNYEVITREPTKTTYRDYEVYGVPPSSSGGITIAETLNILEAYELSNMPRTQAFHYYLEASRYAFADRRQYIGDPDFTLVPVNGLLSKGYAAERRYNIQDDQATIGQIAPGNPWPYEENPDKRPEPPTEGPYAFSYNFIGNDGDTWDSTKFHRLDTGPQSSPYDAEFSLVNNSGQLKVNERKDGRGSAYGRATANMDALENSQLDIRIKTESLGDNQRLRFWLQADVWRSGSTIPSNGYGVEINAQTSELILYRAKNSSLKTLEKVSFDLTQDWHDLQFKVEGNELTAQVWGNPDSEDDSDGEAEPKKWSVSHRLTVDDRLDDQHGRLLISAINFETDKNVSFYLDEARVTDLGEIEIPEAPEQPEDPSNFVYEFTGELDDQWDSSKFNLVEEGATFTIAEDGGEVRFHAPPGSYASSFGKADPIMNDFTNGEVLLSFRLENPKETQNRRLRLWLRADDWSSARSTIVSDGYGAEINTNENRLTLHSGSNSTSIDHQWSEEWMYLKVRAEGDQMKARLWEKGTTEPDEWDVETTIEEKSGKVLMGFHGLTQSSLDGEDAFRIGELSINPFETDEETSAEEEISEADESTIHLAVSDNDGNIVSYTSTIVSIGGNGMVVPGYGFLLNNALYGRIPTQSPSHPNYPRPGMRSLSSMSPTLVMKDGKPVLTVGAPGSDTIITTVLQIMLNNLEFGMPLSDAIAEPRISQRNNFNGLTDYEEIFLTKYPNQSLKDTIAELEKMGHRFNAVKAVQGIGAAIGIEFLEDGRVRPATEPVRRGGGSAMVQSLEPIVEKEKPGNDPPITPPGHGGTPPGLGNKQPGPPFDPPGRGLNKK